MGKKGGPPRKRPKPRLRNRSGRYFKIADCIMSPQCLKLLAPLYEIDEKKDKNLPEIEVDPEKMEHLEKGAQLKKYKFKKQTVSKDCETIKCVSYDIYKDFIRDITGIYILIRIEWKEKILSCAICNKNHKIMKVFQGQCAEDIYHIMLKYEKKNKLKWFQEKSHLTYIGKELKRAEIALKSEDYNFEQV